MKPRRSMILLASCLSAAGVNAVADNYPRQRAIDAVHYKFQIEIGDRSNEIVGEATVELRFTEAGRTTFWLDLATPSGQNGMTVSEVKSDEKSLAFEQDGDRLVVTLADPPAAGDKRTFTIPYRGLPAAGLKTLVTKYGERMFFAENWPDKARQWLPLIDHPSDKATCEFIVIAPSHDKIVANGLLMSETDLKDGRRSTRWSESVPIPSWQFVVAAGPFEKVEGETELGVPIYTWTYLQDKARAPLFDTASRRALAFFSGKIGPYPYEKLAAVEAVSPFSGMENAGTIFYSEHKFNGSDIVPLVAHEVAHQWFGSSVTESDWNEVWLSEGFATYGSLLFIEHDRGRAAFVDGLQRSRDAIFRAEATEPGTPVVHKNLTDMSRVIGTNSYQKGAWALHMLRGIIGDEAFWSGLRDFYTKHRDGNATTDDFRQSMEATSRRDLGPFFDQWLRRTGTPVLRVSWSFDDKASRVILDVRQVQAGDPYRLPLEIGLEYPAERQRVSKIELDQASRRFTIEAKTKPSSVVVDPNFWVLHRIDSGN